MANKPRAPRAAATAIPTAGIASDAAVVPDEAAPAIEARLAAAPTNTTPADTTPAQDETAAQASQAAGILKQSIAGAVAGDEKTQNEVNITMEKAVKSAEELVFFTQGNFEAMMKAGQIWAAGVQELHKTLAATAQAQVEAAMDTFKALSGVKSLQEAMDLQATLARSSMETAMAETGKLTDASVKLAEQALAPITARVTLAVEKFGRVA
jgi:phasin family protein